MADGIGVLTSLNEMPIKNLIDYFVESNGINISISYISFSICILVVYALVLKN